MRADRLAEGAGRSCCWLCSPMRRVSMVRYSRIFSLCAAGKGRHRPKPSLDLLNLPWPSRITFSPCPSPPAFGSFFRSSTAGQIRCRILTALRSVIYVASWTPSTPMPMPSGPHTAVIVAAKGAPHASRSAPRVEGRARPSQARTGKLLHLEVACSLGLER